jgi:hypothetical protein
MVSNIPEQTDPHLRWDYYWIDGRIKEVVNKRSHKKGRWKADKKNKGKLVVSIRKSAKKLLTDYGPMQTPDRVAESLLRFYRNFANQSLADIGSKIPPELLHRLVDELREAIQKVNRQWEETGNEEGQSGFFAGTLNELQKFIFEGWEISIRVQVFSPNSKEPLVGADIGIICDLKNGEERVVKGALVQAKKTTTEPEDRLSLPDLENQAALMKETTDESYGLVYKPEESYMFRTDHPDNPISVEEFFKDTLICRRGDRDIKTVAQAYDRTAVIDLTLDSDGIV